MADTYEKPSKSKEPDDFLREALDRYDRAEERERENTEQAYEDLEFRAGEQWPQDIKQDRELEERPVLTINRMPQFVRQVTNDIRMMRPAIRVVGVDDQSDPETAEVMAGMVRYVENRSDAQAAYFIGCDSQVTAGIGHWQITTEYAGDSTFEQEIRILPIEDGVAVRWDPDSILPTREDAMWCFQPVDMSHAAFKEKYPDAVLQDFRDESTPHKVGWYGEDYVRIARYWCKKPVTRTLAMMPDGQVHDLTVPDRADEATRAQIEESTAFLLMHGARIEQRDGHKVTHCVISATEVLEEEQDWPGRFIPIIPVLGEEVRIGRKVYRHGVIRYAKDPQRLYNYFSAAEAEVVALQPKSPFVGTEKNFEKYAKHWEQANKRPFPFLPYTPDQANGGIEPKRSTPPVSSSGLVDGLLRAADDMKAVIGIYDAGLGQRSNETSGVAIRQRQQESDIGTYAYVDNFARAVRYTGKILIDLIPKIYDTERTIRILGEDGKVDVVKINQPQIDPATGEQTSLHDVTVGSYDVVVDQGPSYTTKREYAREGMIALLQSVPDVAPAIIDIVAKAQDWPLADKIEKRLKTLLPPQIQQMEAEESGEPPPQPPEPGPEAQAEMMKAQAEQQKMQFELRRQAIELREAEIALEERETERQEKAIELQIKQVELRRALTAPAWQENPNRQI